MATRHVSGSHCHGLTDCLCRFKVLYVKNVAIPLVLKDGLDLHPYLQVRRLSLADKVHHASIRSIQKHYAVNERRINRLDSLFIRYFRESL